MCVGTSVPDDGHAFYAQQGRAAVFRIVNLLAKIPVRFLGKNVAHLRTEGALQGILQQSYNVLRDAFADLQRHVADESVANDYIHGAAKNLAPLDIAHKI